MFTFIFLGAAGFLAGFIDAVAGGGGLITLPALLAAGLPPHLALGTNKFQSMFGTSCALINFARKGKVIWKVAALGVPFALVGSALGARLVLFLDPSLVAKIIIGFLPPLVIVVLFSRSILRHHPLARMKKFNFWVLTPLACLLIGTYDGFLGPGTGTFLILALVFFTHLNLIGASATAKTFNLASNVGAFAMFVISGAVYFPYAIAMAGFNIAGNIVGSHFAIKRGDHFIQKILIVSLSLLFAYLIWKYF